VNHHVRDYMNAEVAIDGGGSPAAEKPSFGASRIIRRVHMYLALFLAPWMLIYALSTLAMRCHCIYELERLGLFIIRTHREK
jgi:hypothetical protein